MFHAAVRKLTVDPSLTASLDLDSVSSSDEAEEGPQGEEQAREAVSPETRGKGKGKSPKRMWGKRFKVRLGKWWRKHFRRRGYSVDETHKESRA